MKGGYAAMPQTSEEKLRIAERRHQKLLRRRRRRRRDANQPVTLCRVEDISQPLQWRHLCLPWLSLRKLRIATRRGKDCRVSGSGNVQILCDSWSVHWRPPLAARESFPGGDCVLRHGKRESSSPLREERRAQLNEREQRAGCVAEREEAWLDELADADHVEFTQELDG